MTEFVREQVQDTDTKERILTAEEALTFMFTIALRDAS